MIRVADQIFCTSKPSVGVPNPPISGFYTPRNGFCMGEKLIFACSMKRFAFFSLYWAASLLLLAVLLCSMGYRMAEALMLSTSLLPVAIIFRQMIAHTNFSAKKLEVARSLFFILMFVLIMAFLAVHVAQAVILYDYRQMTETDFSVPATLLNPVFLLAVLTLMMVGDYGLGRILGRHLPEAKETITFASDLQTTKSKEQENSSSVTNEPITFISNRQSMTLTREEILYVESCDTEVWIHATDGRRFRNKTPISSWERLLGAEYLRIHRSYLVRLSACTGLEHDNVIIGEERLPVSRKYKERVSSLLP